MKMWCQMSKLLWFKVIVQLCLLLGAYSQQTSLRRGSSGGHRSLLPVANSPVILTTERHQVVINNSIVAVTLSRAHGYVLGISYAGIDNVLEAENDEDDRGYFDIVWHQDGYNDTFQRINETNFSVITKNNDIVEVSFLKTWQGKSVPINIDQRYILRRGNSGFYTYSIFQRPRGFPALKVFQIRNVFKLDRERFNYMAISDTKQRRMPTSRDRKTGQPLDYPEAVLLTHPSDPQFRGEVDDKYQYSSENQDNSLNGWITADSNEPVGFWIITPSNEFRNAGPIKQDLTSHVGPTCLSMLVSTHYAGTEVAIDFQKGETYTKVFGPVFIHLNSASKKIQFKSLWSKAKQQLSYEINSWPYDFLQSNGFAPPSQRGTVIGSLQVKERQERPQYANNAYIGLAWPGDAGSWQSESKGYQFWTRTDKDGNFVIKNIVPGTYNLFAWVPGFIGDYKYNVEIIVKPGSTIKLGSLIYYPPRNGPTIWEIGIPDRSAAEFLVPSPYSTLTNNLYKNDPSNNFRQYGLWRRYSDLYPIHDLVYTVGVDEYKKDWFYAHVPRILGNKTYKPTTWKIVFELQGNVLRGNYTLQLALASASFAELQVWFNDERANPPHFTTNRIGGDNAVARHGIHGLHRLYSIDIASYHLVKGKNTVYLKQARDTSTFQEVMYDYIRLESPPTNN